MTRLCSACTHPQRADINAALVAHRQGYRVIAARFGLAATSLQRHAEAHLRETLLRSEEARAMLDAEALAQRMRELEADVDWARERAKATGEVKTLLLAVQQGRGNVETLARLAVQGDVEERLARLEAQSRPTPSADMNCDTDSGSDAGAENQ